MKKTMIGLLILGNLVACSPQNATQNSATASAVATRETAVQAASHAAWTPPPKADSPKAEAQQIRDLMTQFQDEAAERMVAQRQKNMQPSQAESLELVRQEAAAIRYDAKRLQQLDLSSKEAIEVQAALSQNMLAYADSADLQVKSAELLAQGKQAEADAVNQQLGAIIKQIDTNQDLADKAYNALLNQHKIKK